MSGKDTFVQEIADAVIARLADKDVKKRILTIGEAAEYLGLTEDAIRHKTSKGQIPVTKIDRYLRFDRVVLDRWIDENTSREE